MFSKYFYSHFSKLCSYPTADSYTASDCGAVARSPQRVFERAAWDGSMPHEKHHQCNFCRKEFESGDELEEHVERRHPKKDVH